MIRAGITGQAGFIGSHLANSLRIHEDIELVQFSRDYFDDANALERFVDQCDVIIHLAAISRHSDGKLLYRNNINLDKKLISALKQLNSQAHVIYASTTHQMREGDYYASKRDGQKLFNTWGGKFTAMIMPNTFGPYGKPYFNSVVSTFCYKVAHGEQAEIMIDAPVELIYINDLCHEFHKVIKEKTIKSSCTPSATATIKVSEILDLLLGFHKLYIEQSSIPTFKNYFEAALFNTFQSYL